MNYQARVLQFRRTDEVTAWLDHMGCDPAGIAIMTPKALFRTVSVDNVPTKAANLLKQTFLAKGAEVAVARGTADLSADFTDVLICGTMKHYRLAMAQLRQQPWGLPDLAAAVEKALANDGIRQQRRFESNGKVWTIDPGHTLIMGILNVTPDSFSDGGRHNAVEAAVERAVALVADGADIIDVGAESTRPYGAVKISAEEEMERLMPALERILNAVGVPVSVDTYKSQVADRALTMGADIINDIWGLQQDREMAGVAAVHGVPLVVMHNRSSVESNKDIISELSEFFLRSVEIGVRAGIAEDRFIIDPGIGFGKNSLQNMEILGRLSELKGLGYPILVGTSRKRFIGEVLNLPVEERAEGTGATVVHSIMNGASIVRVHDVKMAKRMAAMTDALQEFRRFGDG
jgi:dihydropteroate synthase